MKIVATPSALLMALGSGLASAVLFASLIGGTALAVPLFALTPLPIVIVALGWGTVPAILAAAVAATGLHFGLTWAAAVSHAIMAGAPAVVLSHLLGLARDDDGRVEWYPPGRVLVAAGLVVAAASLATGVLVGYDQAATTAAVREVFVAVIQAERGGNPAEIRNQVEPLVALSVRMLPVFFPAVWTAVIVFDLWLGAKVVARSDRLARPWEDLASIEPPAGGGPILAAALVASVLPDPLGLVAAPFAGAMIAVYMIVGLAVLHAVTRDLQARPILLAMVYGVVFLFTFPALILAMIGVADRHFRFRDRRRGGPPSPT